MRIGAINLTAAAPAAILLLASASASALAQHAGHSMSGMAGMPGMSGMAASPQPTKPLAGGPAARPIVGQASADGSLVRGTADHLTVKFARPLAVERLALLNAAGQRLPFPVTLTETPTTSLDARILRLPPGVYRIDYRTAGANPMTGELSFSVQ